MTRHAIKLEAVTDGSRKRRFSKNAARRAWYAFYRAQRFARRFGFATLAE
jgi:hypothetical protein